MQARNRNLLAAALALICAPAFAQHGQAGTHGQAAVHVATPAAPATQVQGSAHASGSQGAQPTRNDDWKDAQSQTSQDATDAMGDSAQQAQGATHAQAHSEVVTRDVFGTLDTDHDGRISATEAGTDSNFNGGFAAMDVDGNGFVSDAEYRADSHIRHGHRSPVPQAGCHRGDLGHCGDKNQSDGKVHEQGMQSTDQRHVTYPDRGSAAYIPEAAHGRDAGIKLPSRRSH